MGLHSLAHTDNVHHQKDVPPLQPGLHGTLANGHGCIPLLIHDARSQWAESTACTAHTDARLMSLLPLEVVKRKTSGLQVKEYGEKNAALREAQAAVKVAVQGSEETEADLTNLYEELSVQRAILDKCGS